MRRYNGWHIVYISITFWLSACQFILSPQADKSAFTLVLQHKNPDNELLEEVLLESLQQKIQRKGYKYKSDPNQAHCKLLVGYQYQLAPAQPNLLVLNVRLSLYDPDTKKEFWSQNASASALRMDNLERLIEPAARALADRFPYAPDFGGVGILIGKNLKIIGFSENSPAKRAGLQKNDLILKIDNQTQSDYLKCQQMLQGKPGTRVEITVWRDDKVQTLKLTRAPMESLMLSDKQATGIQRLSIGELKEKLSAP